MTSYLGIRSRDPRILTHFDKSRRSMLKTCAKKRANQMTCVASFLATEHQFTPSLSPRSEHPSRERTALSSDNYFLAHAQHPKRAVKAIVEVFS